MNLIALKWTSHIWKILIAREQTSWPVLNKVSWLSEYKDTVRSVVSKTFLLKDSIVNKKKENQFHFGPEYLQKEIPSTR